jgi:predicted helicase
VAHYRLHHALAEKPTPANPNPPPLPRLGVYLADTLARPGTSTSMGPLGYTAQPIQHERDEADRIKGQQCILAIIGNPPYWRFQGVNPREIVGPFIDDLWEDLKEPVRSQGRQWANQLNTFPEFSVAFWRWAIWKLFEADNAPQRGVIALITNPTFLPGKPYAGLRKKLRERFDRIEVIDLRGDLRRGERAGVLDDEGVFNIQVGTAITLAIADGSKPEGELASVRYSDTWTEGLYSRPAKLRALEAAAGLGDIGNGIAVARGELADFKPEPFQSSGQWPSIEAVFAFRKSGSKSGNDDVFVAVYQTA